jgi:hypothetical protein
MVEEFDLEARGWTRRSRATLEKAAELRQQYEELGFEVRFEELIRSDFEEKCGSCGQAAACTLIEIYTRR